MKRLCRGMLKVAGWALVGAVVFGGVAWVAGLTAIGILGSAAVGGSAVVAFSLVGSMVGGAFGLGQCFA